MLITLVGYMGSGKSHIAKVLSQKTGYSLIDLDKEISKRNGMSVTDIFESKGEIYFRKQEKNLLEEILASRTNCILSLGGGTPAYYNNMEIINHNSVSFFLRTPVNILAERLSRQKAKRPLIAHLEDEEIPEFIAKHLFERNPFYSKAQFTIDTKDKTPDEIADEIIAKIPSV